MQLVMAAQRAALLGPEAGGIEPEAEGSGVAAADAQTTGVINLGTTAPNGQVLAMAPGVGLREFDFHKVFGPNSTQASVYNGAGRRLVMDFVNGISGSMIVYGQTGSGKTYTMFGNERDAAAGGARPGVVPTACTEVLEALEARRAEFELDLKLSYVEIYGDEIRNLLDGGRVVGQDAAGRTTQAATMGHRSVLDGDCEVLVHTMEEVTAKLAAGDSEKRRSATAMNDYSTRAHAVIVLNLTQRRLGADGDEPVVVSSKLFLADLGGSEKISKSHADDGSKVRNGSTIMDPPWSLPFTAAFHCLTLCFQPLVMMEAIAPPEEIAIKAGMANNKRGWHDADGNFIMQEGGGGMAREGEWRETSRITWAEYYASRKKMQETVNINQGLFALKRCIKALNHNKLARAARETEAAGAEAAGGAAAEDGGAVGSSAASTIYARGDVCYGAIGAPCAVDGEPETHSANIMAGGGLSKVRNATRIEVVPYRDHKLTQLLSEALGGRARTVVVVAAATEPKHAIETIQTLRFGEQCANVESGAAASATVMTERLAEIDGQIVEVITAFHCHNHCLSLPYLVFSLPFRSRR